MNMSKARRHGLLALALLLTAVYANPSQAKSFPVFFGWGDETVVKLADFPDTEVFQTTGGKFFDAGVIYKRVTVFFVPVWIYDIRWAGYIDPSTNLLRDEYVELTREELEEYLLVAGITFLPETPTSALGYHYGWALALVLVLVIFVAFFIVVSIARRSPEPPAPPVSEQG